MATLALWSSPAGRYLERSFLHANFAVRELLFSNTREVSEAIIILGIDRVLFEKFGSPLPRAVGAAALEKLAECAPKAIVIDLALPKDPKETEANERIAAVLKRIPTAIGAGLNGGANSNEPVIKDTAKFEWSTQRLLSSGVMRLIASNLSESSESSTNQFPLLPVLERLGGYSIEGLPAQRDLINYYGPPGSIRNISISELLTMEQKRCVALFANKLVFLGIYSRGESSSATPPQRDEEQFRISSSYGLMYGVEVHATVAANLIDKSWIRVVSPQTEATVVLCSVFILSLLQFFASPRRAYTAVLGLFIFGLTVTFLCFSLLSMWIPGIEMVPVFGLLSVLVVAPFRAYTQERLDLYIEERFRI